MAVGGPELPVGSRGIRFVAVRVGQGILQLDAGREGGPPALVDQVHRQSEQIGTPIVRVCIKNTGNVNLRGIVFLVLLVVVSIAAAVGRGDRSAQVGSFLCGHTGKYLQEPAQRPGLHPGW